MNHLKRKGGSHSHTLATPKWLEAFVILSPAKGKIIVHFLAIYDYLLQYWPESNTLGIESAGIQNIYFYAETSRGLFYI